MGLNKVKEGSQMYQGWVTHTWNPIKGSCLHNCAYCYMKAMAKRFNKLQPPAYFDEKELKTNLGSGNFIFVGSSNDIFAKGIPEEWIIKTLDHCHKHQNRYLFQTKNPNRIVGYMRHPVFSKSVVCTTMESDMYFEEYMGCTPTPLSRSDAMNKISDFGITTFVTIEPIIRFLQWEFMMAIKRCNPTQVNIGADSGHNNLPEPEKEEILQLIAELKKFTVVKQKSNLSRLLK